MSRKPGAIAVVVVVHQANFAVPVAAVLVAALVLRIRRVVRSHAGLDLPDVVAGRRFADPFHLAAEHFLLGLRQFSPLPLFYACRHPFVSETHSIP